MNPGTLNLPEIYRSVPAAMQGAPRWICWRYVEEDGKQRKVPYRADGRGKASSMDQESWATFEEAVTAAANPINDRDGVMFALGDGFNGVDLDDCLVNGVLTPGAASIHSQFPGAYVEISPSGTGLKLFGHGKLTLPNGAYSMIVTKGIDFGRLELYTGKRFFTVTGNVFLVGAA